jgi:hypothetical protein
LVFLRGVPHPSILRVRVLTFAFSSNRIHPNFHHSFSRTGGPEMSRGIRAVGFLEGGAAPFGFKGAGFDFRTGGAEMRRGIRAVGFLEGGAAPFGFKGAGFDST